jgi:DNA-binding transcriptional ArsR family regulator
MEKQLQKYLRSAPVKRRLRTLQAMSGRMRYPILNLLERCPEGLTVKELSGILSASPSRISHQLAILRDNGLIVPTKNGRSTRYALSGHLGLQHVFETLA